MAVEPQWEVLPAGTRVCHVHPVIHPAMSFNPHADPRRLSRFSPIFDARKQPIPSWYGGLTEVGALYETVFRDVAGEADRTVFRAAFARQHLSTVELGQPLQLLVLHGTGPTTLGEHNEITKLLPNRYAESRAAAQRLHDTHVKAQGFIWRSRFDDAKFSFVLYEDRMPGQPLGVVIDSVPLVGSPVGEGWILRAANSLGAVVA